MEGNSKREEISKPSFNLESANLTVPISNLKKKGYNSGRNSTRGRGSQRSSHSKSSAPDQHSTVSKGSSFTSKDKDVNEGTDESIQL